VVLKMVLLFSTKPKSASADIATVLLNRGSSSMVVIFLKEVSPATFPLNQDRTTNHADESFLFS
jgi:hypothetical protein